MTNKENLSKQFDNLVLVPQGLLFEVKETQEKILAVLENLPSTHSSPGVGTNKYISEKEAKDLLGKGTTWFWQMRTQGKLPFKKIGSKIFYSMDSLERLFERNNHE